MNNQDAINKSLSKITRDEKGWRKVLSTSDGSYSRNFAQENLRRLEIEQEMLLNRLKTLEIRRHHIMNVALVDGIITDHVRDGICEQLVNDGWLIRTNVVAYHGGKRASKAYSPTDKASQDWHNVEPTQTQ